MQDGIGGGEHSGGGEHHGGVHHGTHSGGFAGHAHPMAHNATSHGTGHSGNGPSHAQQSAFGHGIDLGGLAHAIGSDAHGHNSHIGHGVGHVPGAATGHSVGWAFGHSALALAYMGALDPATACKNQAKDGHAVRLPGLIFGQNSVQLLVWPHGKCDTAELLRSVAARYGLRSLSRRKGCNLVASSKTEEELLDTKVFDGPGKYTKPSGWFPGAKGITSTSTEYYQLPYSKGWFKAVDVDLGPPMPSHIVITIYTWFTEQIGDYETRIAITVTNPATSVDGRWVTDDKRAARQYFVAERVALAMHEELVSVKPAKYAAKLRHMQSHQEFSTFTVDEPESIGIASNRGVSSPGRVRIRPSTRNASADMIRFDLNGG